MIVEIGQYEVMFNLEDININEKTIYPLNLDFDEIIVDDGFLFCYDMGIEDEIPLSEFEIIEGTDEEVEVFKKLL